MAQTKQTKAELLKELEETRARLSELEKSEEHHRTLIDEVRDMIFSIDAKTGYFLSVNAIIEKTLGYSREELLNDRFFMELVHEKDREGVFRTFQERVYEGAPAREIQFRIIKKDGSIIHAEEKGARLCDDEGNPIAYISMIRDITDRIQAEEKFKESERLYRTLVEEAADIILTVDLKEGVVSSLNNFGLNILGYTTEDIRNNLKYHDFIHSDDLASAAERMLELSTKKIRKPNFPLRIKKADGSYLHVETNGAVLYDSAGNPETFIGVLRDATELRKAEQALRKKEELYKLHFENVGDIVYSIDKNLCFASMSPSIEAVLGYSAEEMIGRSVLEMNILSPGSLEESAANISKVFSGEPVGPLEYEFIAKDGTRKIGEVVSNPLFKNGKVEAMISVARDLTDRKLAERALRESEEEYRGLFENSIDSIFTVDLTGNITSCNPATEEVLGYPIDELIGASYKRLIVPESWERIFKEYNRMFRTGKPLGNIQYDIASKDGERRTIEGNVIPTRSGDKITGFQATARDITDAKKSREALRESEQQYRTTIDSMGEAVHVVDEDLKIILMNTAFKKWNKKLGLETEVYGKTVFEVFPFLPESVRDEYAQVFKNGNPLITEEHTEIQGEKIIVETRKVPIFEGEKVKRVLTVIRDITEKKRADEALRASEERFRSLIENASDAVAIVDANGTIIYESPSVEKVLGYTPEEIVGTNGFDLMHPDDREEILEKFAEVVSDREKTLLVEFRCKHGNGSWMVVETSAKQLPDGTGVVLNYRDITERKRTREAIEASERRYRLLAENLTDIIWTTDLNLQFTYVSPSVTRSRGYTVEEAVAQSMEEVLTPDSLEHARTVLAKALAEEYANQGDTVRTETLELEHYCKDGPNKWFEVAVSFLHDDDGAPNGLLGVSRDITENKKLQQQLLQAQKMESIGTLAGGIAHDFNNLLGGILGYASFMKSKMEEGDPFFKYADTIERTAERAAELTSQLLGFARGGKYNVRAVDLNSVVDETLRIVGRTFNKSIDIESRLSESIPTVEADAGQLQQVLMNLCVNAKDAMPGGGRLTVETDVETITEEYAGSHMDIKPGLHVRLAVTDTGIGIDKETQKRIFEPFFTTKEEGKGTGLGLSMVYGVIKNHGGQISIYSEVGHGTTFKIYLPISGKAEIKESLEVEAALGKNELILVVDDEEHIRSLAQEVLEEHNYRVMLAKDGAEAVEIFEECDGAIDMVLLDLIMPNMGGHETFLRMKAHNPGVKALLSTGYSQNGKAKEILGDGVSGFVQKPYQPNKLLSKIRSILDTEA